MKLGKILVIASSLTGATITSIIGFQMLQDYPVLQAVYAVFLIWFFGIVPAIFLAKRYDK